MGELSADTAHELAVEMSETGESSGIHSGGVVVLRCTVGLDGFGCPGGFTALDKARR